MEFVNDFIILIAALCAGFVNALAGGGTLITFPVLLSLGIAPVTANITNTVALVPGTIGGIIGQRNDFKTQKSLLIKLLPTAILGGITGGIIILTTDEKIFSFLIPYLILIATLLLAFQAKIKKVFQAEKNNDTSIIKNKITLHFPVFVASIYGGYFGAGLGVILMAILGLLINENITKLNFLKQALAFSINLAASIYFVFSGNIDWLICSIMIFGSISGGLLGGKLAGIINPEQLKVVVIAAGFIASVFFFFKD